MNKVPCNIFDLLYQLGISAKYNGFFQTACAVELCRPEPERLQLVTKMVYPEVAKLCRTNSSSVERNIRTVCEIIWKNNRRSLERLAYKPLPQKPANTQFLAILMYSLPIFQSIPGEEGLAARALPDFREEGNVEGQGESNEEE